MTELEKWLEENKAHFATYSLNEIADIAVASGFRNSDVAAWMTKQKFKAA